MEGSGLSSFLAREIEKVTTKWKNVPRPSPKGACSSKGPAGPVPHFALLSSPSQAPSHGRYFWRLFGRGGGQPLGLARLEVAAAQPFPPGARVCSSSISIGEGWMARYAPRNEGGGTPCRRRREASTHTTVNSRSRTSGCTRLPRHRRHCRRRRSVKEYPQRLRLGLLCCPVQRRVSLLPPTRGRPARLRSRSRLRPRSLSSPRDCIASLPTARLRVVTAEPQPRVLELTGRDVFPVSSAFW